MNVVSSSGRRGRGRSTFDTALNAFVGGWRIPFSTVAVKVKIHLSCEIEKIVQSIFASCIRHLDRAICGVYYLVKDTFIGW